MKTLLIDNYDSFTYNLFQLLAEVNGEDPTVVRNDWGSWGDVAEEGFDNIVISPGPGRPDSRGDFGFCADAIRDAEIPLLGVCLGHQGIAHLYGGTVTHAPDVMHGRLSAIHHDGSPLFDGIPQGFKAVRYHSLHVPEPVPADLERIAWTSDGVLMGLAHRSRPVWGVQFHPESICTEFGRRLLTNFRDLTVARAGRRRVPPKPAGASRWSPPRRAGLALHVERIDHFFDAEQVFVNLYSERDCAFWLDSSRIDERSRFSFMGATGGPLSAVVTYDVGEQLISVDGGLSPAFHGEAVFDYLSRELTRLRDVSDELPFDFNGGFVGYLGYELKADCEGELQHRSTLPDAAFVFADRLIAFDHYERCLYLVCVAERAAEADARRWLDDTAGRLAAMPPVEPVNPVPASQLQAVLNDLDADATQDGPFHLSRSHQQYLDDIRRVKDQLADGESYEVCLTNKVHAALSPDPLLLYRTLRRVNGAPFSAYLRFGDTSILSSSPERFLSVGRDRWVEAKPIKGTCRRGDDPEEDARLAMELRTDEKTRAENLMITDLLRNDLGIVCEAGTVHVPHLMAIESYETVHQMVSTVRGRLRDGIEPPDCVRACFPGGSMTGAPKVRTMKIIDALEGESRGVYSGAIGYFGLSGSCDLSIVIRTIVMHGGSATIGMGGAIVMQSDPEDEFQETVLKARALIEALMSTEHQPVIT